MHIRRNFCSKIIMTFAMVVVFFCLLKHGQILRANDTKLQMAIFNKTLNEADSNLTKAGEAFNSKPSKNILDGCYHVYLDVGSNVGIQVRKLFEPELYPGSGVLGLYNSSFGKPDERRGANTEQPGADHMKTVCAVGFEPNSRQTEKLKLLENSYNKCGWFVKFFTESAVSDHEGEGNFFTDNSKWEWGGGVLPPDVIRQNEKAKNKSSNYKTVKMIRLSSFLRDVVAARKIGPVKINKLPEVVMKMDIEGSEVEVIADLILSGSIKYVNLLMVEWHRRRQLMSDRQVASDELDYLLRDLSAFCKTTRKYNKNGEVCRFKSLHRDDEKFFNSEFDLPKC